MSNTTLPSSIGTYDKTCQVELDSSWGTPVGNGDWVGESGSPRGTTDTLAGVPQGLSIFKDAHYGDVPSGVGRGGSYQPSLVSASITAQKLNKRRRRCFHRVMSGLERGGYFRVLMLSSGIRDRVVVQKAFHALREWGRRHGLLVDYIRVPELTEAGYIHLHIVYRGKFIDRLLLMRKWYSLVGGSGYMPGMKYVYLQHLESKRGIAHYLAKYMAKGEAWASGNYSWSMNWVWRGFVKDWNYLTSVWRCVNHGWGVFADNSQELPFKWLLNTWRWHLATGIPP